MTSRKTANLLDAINSPADLRALKTGDLPALSDELRDEVIAAVSQTGGHLGSGLGVVELTVALHYVFDTPRARLIWDVSHQCYPHKVLTGRRDRITTLRQGGGLSGFTSRKESEHDPFGAAHSSTAMSAALGFAAARDFSGDDNDVIAVVGDGAMTAGMAYEALNNIGSEGRKVIVILNDNHMSIAPPAGALSHYLTELRDHMPDKAARDAALAEGGLPSFAGKETMFDALGVPYAGPFDGHDVEEMIAVLQAAKAMDGPVIIHTITVKGKGYAPAEASADCYHGVATFDVDSGKQNKGTPKGPKYQDVFAKTLIELAKTDAKIVAVSAAMPSGTSVDKFAEVYPDRAFDVGIAEQHAVTFCGAMAAEGYRPFAAIYSTFLQRAYDQVVHDIAIQGLPVRFAIDRAGMVGADGVTHQGSYDVTYLGCLPGFVLMAAADDVELAHMVATAAAIDDRPSAFRFPRGEGSGLELPANPEPLEIGRGRILREGSRVAILSYGTRLDDSLKAAGQLEAAGYSTTVADARFAKPIDDELVGRLARDHELLITVEEGAIGGFSAQVVDSLARQRLEESARLRPMYLPDTFIDHDKPAEQIKAAQLSADFIVACVLEALSDSGNAQRGLRVVST